MKVINHGGKEQGLSWLAENTDIGYKVLPYECIDASYHDEVILQPTLAQIAALLHHKINPNEKKVGIIVGAPKRLEERCIELSNHFIGNGVKVRSSGLESEDNKRFSGAGIYNSFSIKKEDLNPQTLLEAVLKIYVSVHTERAVKYRQNAGIENERMEVVVHKLLKPHSDWQGVMFTSNPTYPRDLTIEFGDGDDSVVDGRGTIHILEYNKQSKQRVFKSEDLRENLNFDPDVLFKIGAAIEKRDSPSDIEFLVKDGEFYLIQKRKITDLQKPKQVKIPAYKPEQFIGSTNIKRGVGKITLPVVKIADMSDVTTGADETGMFAALIRDEKGITDALAVKRNYFETVLNLNKKYSSGYILITPHFYETNVEVNIIHANMAEITDRLGNNISFDNLTNNKRAIITTNSASISSHVMTIAREKGIGYAGFPHSEDLFKKVHTGDIVSIYFQGREAKVFLEPSPLRNIHQSNPEVSFNISRDKWGISFKTSTYLESDKPYTDDFVWYLKTSTGQEWKFKPYGGMMGGAFVNPDGKNILMNISKMNGMYHQLRFAPPDVCKGMGYKPVPKKQLEPIIEGYVKHLQP